MHSIRYFKLQPHRHCRLRVSVFLILSTVGIDIPTAFNDPRLAPAWRTRQGRRPYLAMQNPDLLTLRTSDSMLLFSESIEVFKGAREDEQNKSMPGFDKYSIGIRLTTRPDSFRS